MGGSSSCSPRNDDGHDEFFILEHQMEFTELSESTLHAHDVEDFTRAQAVLPLAVKPTVKKTDKDYDVYIRGESPCPKNGVTHFTEVCKFFKLKYDDIPSYELGEMASEPYYPTFDLDTVNQCIVSWRPSNIFHYGRRNRNSTFQHEEHFPKGRLTFKEDCFLGKFLKEAVFFYSQEQLQPATAAATSQGVVGKRFSMRSPVLAPEVEVEVERILANRPKLRIRLCSCPSSSNLTSVLALIELVFESDLLAERLGRFEQLLCWLHEMRLADYYNRLVIARSYDEVLFRLKLVQGQVADVKESRLKALATLLSCSVAAGSFVGPLVLKSLGL